MTNNGNGLLPAFVRLSRKDWVRNEVTSRKWKLQLISSSSECSAQGQVLHCKPGTKAAVLLKGRSFTANLGTKIAVLLG